MKSLQRVTVFALFSLSLLLPSLGETAPNKGEIAPSFTALEQNKKRPLIIVYFFKLSSKPAREGLKHLKKLYQQYKGSGIGVIAVSRDKLKTLDSYLQENPLPFTVVEEGEKIFKDYGVALFFPTTYLIGPGRRISDIIEGGGPTSELFITTVAQRSLQLKKPRVAKELYESVLEENPKNVSAQSGLAHVYLEEGLLDKAKAVFKKIARRILPESTLGKEGMVAAHLKEGKPEKALAIAREIKKENPESGLADLVQGDILTNQGDHDGALASYQKAIEGNRVTDVQKADAFNKMGRIYSEKENYVDAGPMYQKAIYHNSYSSEILTDRGVLFEKQGKSKKALAHYQAAVMADPDDAVAHLLEKRVIEHLAFKENMERQKRVDVLVTDLVKRFQEGKASKVEISDPWSSRPMNIAFLGLKSMGGGLLREGMAEILQEEIGDQMAASGRISLVEREILDQLLSELKLGSSDLVDPDTALRLGKLFAARLIITGRLIQVPKGLRLSLRVIDPETAKVKITHADKMSQNNSLPALANETGVILSQKIKNLYPLKGKIALVREEGQVIINIGKKHGVLPGIRMKIISEEEPIVLDGKMIGHLKKKVGFLEIIEVEETLSYGKLLKQTGEIKKGQKVLEDVEHAEKKF